MDEGLLNDLLECSVCLERLDTSSRVLPCQHTFCLKCLKVIVESHKELRCPECRVLVETKVEDLPPNVLLMRILEGMKNNTPRKPGSSSAQRAARVAMLQQQSQQSSQLASKAGEPKAARPHARALYDYRSKEIGDLSFKKGEMIVLHKRLDPFWYQGECSGRTGVFPVTYVQVIVPLAVPTALCKALYDFRMSAPDEEGCLAFDKGAIITVHRRVDENWAEGRIEDRVGIFPIAFVELNQSARQLINSPTLNRPVPPLPDHVRLVHPEHRHHVQHVHRYQQMSVSMPQTQTYQNVAINQSQPSFQSNTAVLSTPNINHAILPRSLLDKTKNIDVVSQNHTTQNVARVSERLRPKETESTYQNVRNEFPTAVANFNNNSDSSTSTPSANNSDSSHTSSSDEPSSPSSPIDAQLNSVAVLALNESSANTTANESTNDGVPQSDVIGPESLPLLAYSSQSEARVKEKRHSLTPSTHLGTLSVNVNRHSAEILSPPSIELERDRRVRRSHSVERPLPAQYVAVYPYKPQKSDELELRKGGVYTVVERCRDGWFKGCSERSQRVGVFPGNYVTPTSSTRHANKHEKVSTSSSISSTSQPSSNPNAPDAPPREEITSTAAQPQVPYPWNTSSQHSTPKNDKAKEKAKLEKSSISSGVSLMKRLAAMKKCKSPPPNTYSMDNPVFEDTPSTSVVNTQPAVHVRSGSCPSQLLRTLPVERMGSSSQRLRTKERPSIMHDAYVHARPVATDSSWPSQHRKSQSLDVTAVKRDKDRTHTQTVKERFRCIVPYPPNSEYELELKVDDIVLVHRKRGDGWYKGTLQRTGRTGLFPASFVKSCPE